MLCLLKVPPRQYWPSSFQHVNPEGHTQTGSKPHIARRKSWDHNGLACYWMTDRHQQRPRTNHSAWHTIRTWLFRTFITNTEPALFQNCSKSLADYFFPNKFLLWNNFRFTGKIHKSYRELPRAPSPLSPVNILCNHSTSQLKIHGYH
jgi:hypothetical protein